ncbi:MAG TPA: hypothetical protein VKU91_00230 [Acidimicrobiales bacterium]|nr:hypothetical protein [Acidimicrobiales bacterium]
MARSTFPQVEAMDWDAFIRLLRREWAPGEHMSIVAPTGEGKTTVVTSILTEVGHKWELALDPKGGDSTLAALDWPRISGLPPPKRWHEFWRRDIYQDMAEGRPFRAIVGNVTYTVDDVIRLRSELGRTLDDVFAQGGWTVAIDEFQILADKRLMDLGAEAERLLIAARDKGVRLVMLFQAPRWVPRASQDQTKWNLVGLTRDKDVVERLAEMLGRSRAEIQGAISGLGARPYSWLCARNNPRQPLIVTRPPAVARRNVRTG